MRQTWCFDHGSDKCDCFAAFVQAFTGDTSDTHTPADLAMALELADLMAYYDIGDVFDTRDSDVANWLRAQVIAALRGER
jgi:hypothetical protein